LNGIDSLARFQ